jgi:hypothetical protein
MQLCVCLWGRGCQHCCPLPTDVVHSFVIGPRSSCEPSVGVRTVFPFGPGLWCRSQVESSKLGASLAIRMTQSREGLLQKLNTVQLQGWQAVVRLG